jgi:hypothetical protein
MKNLFPILLALIAVAGCMETPPTMVDGSSRLFMVAVWDTVDAGGTTHTVRVPDAKVILMSEYGTMIASTDARGELHMDRLPASLYTISVRRPHPSDPSIQLVGTLTDVRVSPSLPVEDTIRVRPISGTGICINEVYSAGPVNSIFFFFDQYIELYNASDSLRYLDGMMIMRVSGNSDGKGPGADEGDDNDLDGVTYVYRFPGKPGGQQFPIAPKQFVVLASDGVNHRTMVAGSVDLSRAGWEFYNPFQPEDIDNPSVPNLLNMRSDNKTDFLISLTNDVIMLSSGTDSVWTDGIGVGTVVDAVEYQSSPPPTNLKTLDARVDRGYALTPPRYSGRSIQRREPGSDSNDSTIDFEITPSPTPGYH